MPRDSSKYPRQGDTQDARVERDALVLKLRNSRNSELFKGYVTADTDIIHEILGRAEGSNILSIVVGNRLLMLCYLVDNLRSVPIADDWVVLSKLVISLQFHNAMEFLYGGGGIFTSNGAVHTNPGVGPDGQVPSDGGSGGGGEPGPGPGPGDEDTPYTIDINYVVDDLDVKATSLSELKELCDVLSIEISRGIGVLSDQEIATSLGMDVGLSTIRRATLDRIRALA